MTRIEKSIHMSLRGRHDRSNLSLWYYKLRLLHCVCNDATLLMLSIVLFTAFILVGCIEEPVKEDVPELITKVKLTFTPTGGGNIIEAFASDPDGEGIQDIQTNGTVILSKNVAYTLIIELFNELADIASPEYNITNEVEEEGGEHMIFFAWTNNLFSSPTGNGNADNRIDPVNYEDEDENGLPIGLNTSWVVASSPVSGIFRIILKHQPDVKTSTSESSIGETDLDVTFDIEVQ